MKLPAKIIDRAKFVLGVLAVWAGVHVITIPYHMWQQDYRRSRWGEYRMGHAQLGELSEGGRGDPFGPIPWLAHTRATE